MLFVLECLYWTGLTSLGHFLTAERIASWPLLARSQSSAVLSFVYFDGDPDIATPGCRPHQHRPVRPTLQARLAGLHRSGLCGLRIALAAIPGY